MVVMDMIDSAILSDWIKVHGPIPAIHLAWIGSRLMNIATWAGWAGWTLPNISLDNVAINPVTHDVMLLGGWEMVMPPHQRPLVASKRTLSLCPSLTSKGYIPPKSFNQEIVRLTLKEAVNDPSGMNLTLPGPMIDWIKSPPHYSTLADFTNWHMALENSFGPRKFVKWDKAVDKVY